MTATAAARRLAGLACAGILAAALATHAQAAPAAPAPAAPAPAAPPPSSSPAPPPSSSPEAFQRWAREAARQQAGDLCRFGAFQLDERQPRAFFAVLRRQVDKDLQFTLIATWGEHQRVFVTEPVFVTSMDCPKAPRWETGKHVRLGPWGPDKDYATIAVADGELVLLSQASEGGGVTTGVRWDEPGEGFTNDEDPADSAGKAILLILDAGSPWRGRLPPPRNWVTFGRAAHTGPADAEIDARVDLAAADRTLRVRLSAKDDVARPLAAAGAPDAAFIKADHFELWFCAGGKGQSCDKRSVRQLGVARLADGKLHARWLHPKGNKEPLPAVTGDAAAVEVTLPLARVQHDQGLAVDVEGKLTAVYSDSDGEGKGQETIVATSQLRWGNPDSFGRFVRLPDGARFPRFSEGAGFEQKP
jgi:hypothetical protein